MAKKRTRKRGLRFTVVMEFLVGLLGFYGIGRLLAGRFKEARLLLIISLLLMVPIDLTPRLVGDIYAVWMPWLVKGILALVSAAQLNFVLSRA